MRTRFSTALATLLLFIPAAASADRNLTAFELLDDGSVVVPVTIGGTGPYRFVLDTGSSRTVISTRLSRALKRPAIAKTLMVTPAGRNVTDVVRLEDITIAGRPMGNIAAAVLPQYRDDAGRIDGLIGQDLLSKEIYSVDYQRRVIRWHAPSEVLDGMRLPLTVRENRLLVTLPQRGHDDNLLELIPDTGADSVVIFAHAASKLRFTMHEIGVLSSVSGARLVRRIVIDDLRIGDAHLRNHEAAIVPDDGRSTMMGDGLLPLHVFSRVTFNVAEGFVIFRQR